MRYVALGFGLILAVLSNAETNQQILNENTNAIVYLQIEDSNGGVLDHGTGFIVSGDGYVVTEAHLKTDQTQQMWAVIGQRQGARLSPSFRDADNEVALWQLPQSASCYDHVTLSTASVANLDHVLAIGFPGNGGMTPTPLVIKNVISPRGYYKADSMLQPGDSGGPVFNENGQVIAIVQGGTSAGTNNNDLVPIALGINLVKKWGVRAGIDAPISCGTLRPVWTQTPLITSFPNPPYSCGCVTYNVPSPNSQPMVNGLPTAPAGTTAKLTNNCKETISALFMKTDGLPMNPAPPTVAVPGRSYALAQMQPGQDAIVDLSGSSGGGIVFLNCPYQYIGPPK